MKIYVRKIDELQDRPEELLEDIRRGKINACKRESKKHELIAAGHLLREALSDYGYALPEGPLEFVYNCYGKPYLQENPLYFSLSHSGDCVLCAVSEEEIGADIEKIEPVSEGIARKILTESETLEWESLPKTEDAEMLRTDWLIQKWTEKESIAKLLGGGLHIRFQTLSAKDYDVVTEVRDGYRITVARNAGK